MIKSMLYYPETRINKQKKIIKDMYLKYMRIQTIILLLEFYFYLIRLIKVNIFLTFNYNKICILYILDLYININILNVK